MGNWNTVGCCLGWVGREAVLLKGVLVSALLSAHTLHVICSCHSSVYKQVRLTCQQVLMFIIYRTTICPMGVHLMNIPVASANCYLLPTSLTLGQQP